ncbi:MAG: methylated-DNA--[protein]-cysteine S-methyltransferase [Chitinivibrionales bacterium]|nr:methylated-DNA--[protein]-cysteine S-methyltransferase [Chitinivibrionales bacterium]
MPIIPSRQQYSIASIFKNCKMEIYKYTIRHAVTNCTVYCRVDPVAVVWIDLGITRRLHGAAAMDVESGKILRIGDLLRRFLDGSQRDLGQVAVDVSGITMFAREVLGAARMIPWGTVVSYAELARMAGHAGAVRAAASVMRRNPCPLIIPCHRVVRSDGTIGGFKGKTKGGCVDKKRMLLGLEGVSI